MRYQITRAWVNGIEEWRVYVDMELTITFQTQEDAEEWVNNQE